MKKTLTDSEMMELRQLGYLGGATIGDLIEFKTEKDPIQYKEFYFILWNEEIELINRLYQQVKSILERDNLMKSNL